jgi:apolipoprotein N-acyltransferase
MDSLRNGAQLLAVSTNDSWFTDSRGVWMHHAQSQLRAIETGRYVVRSANTGVSSVINDRGEVLESLAPLKTGYVLETARISDRVTVYSVIGNVFAYACIALCAAAILCPAFERVIHSVVTKCKSKRA